MSTWRTWRQRRGEEKGERRGEEEGDGRGAIESEGRKEERRVREERKGEEGTRRAETKDEHLPHTLLTLCSDPPATNSMRIASFGGV